MSAFNYPQQNPLELNVVGTRKGAWLIRVGAVIAADDSDKVSLQLILRRVGEDESSATRRLYAVVPASDLEIPPQRVLIAEKIREWIEGTEGNGFLDLSSFVAPFAA